MAKFEVGDRVRCILNNTEWSGMEGVIVKIVPATKKKGEVLWVILDGHPCPFRDDKHWQFYSRSFTLAERAALDAALAKDLTAALAPLFDQLKTGASDRSS